MGHLEKKDAQTIGSKDESPPRQKTSGRQVREEPTRKRMTNTSVTAPTRLGWSPGGSGRR